MFPLNAVIFPGVSVPLNVFEDRYRALVHHLLRVEDPTQRLFGSVGIREGYEVGDHGAQSLFRIGCRVQLTEVESHPDGTFAIVAVGLDRIQLERLDTTGTFPVGQVVDRPEHEAPVSEELLERARATFSAYRAALSRDPRSTPTRAPSRRTRPTSPGPWPPARRCRCTSGRALLEAEDAARAAAPGHRPAARRAARDERHPVAAGHRGRAHPLVAQLGRSTGAVRQSVVSRMTVCATSSST